MWKAAICQVDSQMDKEAALRAAGEMVRRAARSGARLAAFPENVTYMGRGYRKQAEPAEVAATANCDPAERAGGSCVRFYEQVKRSRGEAAGEAEAAENCEPAERAGSSARFFAEAARENDIWIMTGSFPESDPSGKPKNTLLLIDPNGQVRAKYSKIHLFDMEIEGQRPQLESAQVTAGNTLTLCETELGTLGFGICYDLRFPEMFRLLALEGARVIFLPASFTRETGEMHWKTLLRARAIENGVYIIAPDQCGHKTTLHAHGHSDRKSVV